MFTGLVQATGTIERVQPLAAGLQIEIDARALAPRPIRVGDSVAVNGCCLTATRVDGACFRADLSTETLARTCGLDAPGEVNLETSLALGDVLGGHLVSGHVDGVGRVTGWRAVGESIELVLQVPLALARFVAVKGSLAVQGVSLTVNRVADGDGGCECSINLIPHTLHSTTLGRLGEGARVNLEIDLLARYAERILTAPRPVT